ncbi:MAG: hypothetical protein HZA93_24835 [Verrucomicrobia bacterium]|nr:hypothetical protein [Verrucomicrobiota bacterium]
MRGVEFAGVELRVHGGGRAVFDETGELGEEDAGAFARGLVGAAERENLLELVEREDGREQAVFRGPDVDVLAVKIFPQSFARAKLWSIGFRRCERGGESGFDLVGEGGRGPGLLTRVGRGHGSGDPCHVGMIEAEVERQVIGLAEKREEAGVEQRGFAEARLAEEHGERLPADEAREFVGFLLATEEKLARVLRKRREAGPRIVAVDAGGETGGGVEHRSFYRGLRGDGGYQSCRIGAFIRVHPRNPRQEIQVGFHNNPLSRFR